MAQLTQIEAERALLGALLLHEQSGITTWEPGEVQTLLSPDAFVEPVHQAVFKAIVQLWKLGRPLDLVTAVEALEGNRQLPQTPWITVVVELAESVPSVANCMAYVEVVREAWQRRMIGRIGERLTTSSMNGSTVTDAIQEAGRALDALQDARSARPTDAVELIPDFVESLRHVARTILPTGVGSLDVQLGGLARGELFVLGASTSRGKTAFGLQVALNVSHSAEPVPAAVFSLEMPARALMLRLAAHLADLVADDLRRGQTDEATRDLILARMNDSLLPQRLWLIDEFANIDRIAARVRSLARQHGLGLAVVDYLQLVQPSQRQETRNLDIATITAALKRLAIEADVAVLALSQLTRSPERDTRMPRLADLRDSGAIEQDADRIGFLHRPDAANPGRVVFRLAKNRQGPLFEAGLVFDARQMLFLDESPF